MASTMSPTCTSEIGGIFKRPLYVNFNNHKLGNKKVDGRFFSRKQYRAQIGSKSTIHAKKKLNYCMDV